MFYSDHSEFAIDTVSKMNANSYNGLVYDIQKKLSSQDKKNQFHCLPDSVRKKPY